MLLNLFPQMREREGERLYKDILGKVNIIERIIKDIDIVSKEYS